MCVCVCAVSVSVSVSVFVLVCVCVCVCVCVILGIDELLRTDTFAELNRHARELQLQPKISNVSAVVHLPCKLTIYIKVTIPRTLSI